MHPPCETCRILSESLNDARERYAVATLHMGELAGAGSPDLFNTARLETQSLHLECEAIKAELKRHNTEHHSTEGLEKS
jgi:hypothetical protein